MRHAVAAMAKRIFAIAIAALLAGPVSASACPVPPALNAAAGEIVARTNTYRKASGRSALMYSAKLAEAAQKQACHMAAIGAISHTGAAGSSLAQRVTAEGYAFGFAAENVAAGYRSSQAVFSGWKGSRGHRANMLNRRATEIGIGWAISGDTSYWVMVLAAPR